MSWGYFIDLRIGLSTAAWNAVRGQKPADIALAPGWSGLKDREFEHAFSVPTTKTETFAEVLAWKCYTGKEAIERIESKAGVTTVRVCVLLDKSLLDLAYPLATLFQSARAAGGEGSLRLVNDGTSSGEDGVELALTKGAITSKPVGDCWKIVEQLGAELFGNEIFEDDEPPAPVKRPAAKKVTAKQPAARARKPAAKPKPKPAAKPKPKKQPTKAATKAATKKPPAAKKPVRRRAISRRPAR